MVCACVFVCVLVSVRVFGMCLCTAFVLYCVMVNGGSVCFVFVCMRVFTLFACFVCTVWRDVLWFVCVDLL